MVLLGLIGIGAAAALYRPSSEEPPCSPDELRFVDAGVGPPLATCGPEGERPAGALLAMGGKLDLNRATEDDLMLLPGVGRGLARTIVKARSEHGRFRSWDEVDEVPGVGAGKMELLQAHAELRQ